MKTVKPTPENIELYESLNEFITARPEAAVVHEIKNVMRDTSEYIAVDSDMCYVCGSEEMGGKLYWRVKNFPENVFIRGSMAAEGKIVFPVDVEDFEDRIQKCSFCRGPAEEFRDKLSEKEYTLSGMCQRCQDKTFGKKKR